MNIIPFLFGFLLICIPLFRQDFFVRHSTIFPLYFFLFPIGLAVMLWSVSGKSVRRWAILLAVFVIIELGLVGSVAYMAHYQRYEPLSENYFYWIRGQYGFFKNTTNFDTRLSRWDSVMGYRFQPNITGRFTNPEFDVEIRTNSLGVRDDEASLRKPQIVVLGDSHGMGWGVAQEDRLSEVMERQLRTNVLNTAITSYGTHRESKLLRQVDLDSCKLVVIQYCDNDLEENKANLVTAQKMGIDAIGFEVARKHNVINRTYFPFKGIFLTLRWLITTQLKNAFQNKAPQIQDNGSHPVAAPRQEHAEAFFPYIERIRAFYKGPIVVFDLGVFDYALVKELQAYHQAHPIDDVHFVNVHEILKRQDYFTIDDHINASGHEKIGTALAALIKENGWLHKSATHDSLVTGP